MNPNWKKGRDSFNFDGEKYRPKKIRSNESNRIEILEKLTHSFARELYDKRK